MTAAVVDITVTDGAAERKLALGTAFHSVLAANFRQKIVKWRHFEPAVILCAVRWYLRYSLSCRDVRELLVDVGAWQECSSKTRLQPPTPRTGMGTGMIGRASSALQA
jgi:hypothetical protein